MSFLAWLTIPDVRIDPRLDPRDGGLSRSQLGRLRLEQHPETTMAEAALDQEFTSFGGIETGLYRDPSVQ